MRFGLSVPNFGALADPAFVGELARTAELTGWDGLFIWDHIAISNEFPIGDPWIALAAAAVSTSRIRLGTMVTPLPRRRPWKVARESVGIDLLSEGRFTLGVGSGSNVGGEFDRFGEAPTMRERSGRLDEGLEILERLWLGEALTFRGRYFQIEDARFRPRPVQRPRIPVVVAGHWPHEGPIRRAARWDGFAPLVRVEGGNVRYLTAEEIRAALAAVARIRGSVLGFEMYAGGSLVAAGSTTDQIRAAAEAGATWWLGLIEMERALTSTPEALLGLVGDSAGRPIEN